MRTVVDPRFRGLLTNLVMARGVTQRALAAEAGISQACLSELLSGLKQPSRDTARKLDTALDAGGQIVNLVVPAGRDDDLDRITASVGVKVTDATVTSLAAVLAAQRHLDDTMGSAALIGSTLAQMDTVTRLVVSASGSVRPRLMSVAAEYAQFTGWLHTSVGKYDKARRWFGQALEWGMEAADNEMVATVLSYQGHVAWLTAQWGPTVGLSNAALRDRTVYPGQRAYDAFQAARGHAALGELPAAEKMLLFGDELAAATDQWLGRVPPWQYYRQSWFWSLERGLAYRYMSRWDDVHAENAVTHLRAGIDGMPEDMRGADWAAEYMIHLGAAYATAGDPQQAGEWLARARQIALDTRSPRVEQMARLKERSLEFACR